MYEIEIRKIINFLPKEKNIFNKVKLLDSLRYFYTENEKEQKTKKVIYNENTDELEYCKSIEIGIELIKFIQKNINKIENEKKTDIINIMKNNYYYLARYLFSYYAVAIEFGIAPEKQFLAPRTSVLIPIAKKLDKFAYKPKAVMTISMPQGTGKTELRKKIYVMGSWKRSRFT